MLHFHEHSWLMNSEVLEIYMKAVANHIAMYPKTCMHAIGLIFTIQQQYKCYSQKCIQNVKLSKYLNSYMLMFSKVH